MLRLVALSQKTVKIRYINKNTIKYILRDFCHLCYDGIVSVSKQAYDVYRMSVGR